MYGCELFSAELPNLAAFIEVDPKKLKACTLCLALNGQNSSTFGTFKNNKTILNFLIPWFRSDVMETSVIKFSSPYIT